MNELEVFEIQRIERRCVINIFTKTTLVVNVAATAPALLLCGSSKAAGAILVMLQDRGLSNRSVKKEPGPVEQISDKKRAGVLTNGAREAFLFFM